MVQKGLTQQNILKRIKTYNKNYRKENAKSVTNSGKLWTEEEDKLVVQHSMKDRDLAKRLGRSLRAIQNRRSKLRNRNPRVKSFMSFHKYTPAEIDLIKNPANPIRKVAEKIGVSYSAANNMRYKYRQRKQ